MPRRYPSEIRRQVVELARSGTRVKQLASTFGMSEATIYNWTKQEQIDRGEIADVHKASGATYGEMRVTAELRYGRNIVVGHNAVGSIMRELGIKGLPTRRLPKGAKVPAVTSLDLVRREFRRDGPNQLWMT